MSPAKTATKKAAKSRAAAGKSAGTFSAEEKAAMKELVRERKANASKEEDAQAVLDRIAAMKEPDRRLARRVHAIIMAAAPDLAPKTWYGMPAYARDGRIICFFQDAAKFKARYATLGFNDGAHLDDGHFWPTSFALLDLTPEDEARIAALVKKAVS